MAVMEIMEAKPNMSDKSVGPSPELWSQESYREGTVGDVETIEKHELEGLGYESKLRRNRSLFTMLFQSLAIAAIPWGFGGPLLSAIYGGGQLAMFVGWIVVLVVDECIAISLGELASKYPTSGGPYYWAYQIASVRSRTVVSYVTGWIWIVGNWTITLSVNFGFASLLVATVALYHPELEWPPWQVLLVFYGLLLLTFLLVAFGNRFLPTVDTFCAIFTLITIIVTLVCLFAKADTGRHDVKYTLAHYDTTLSGWGGFSFMIGTLPSAYTFSALGMITSMAEECRDPTRQLPKALALCVPVGGLAGIFFIIPLCATLPPLLDLLDAPAGQALPYVYLKVMGTPGGAFALTFLVIIVTFLCSVSITTAASRATWAFARDNAIPFSSLWSKVNERHGTPIWALALTTAVQALLGLVNLGSTSAFTAFVSVGVIALAVSYAIPISLSMMRRRKDVATANWTVGSIVGWTVNIVAILWIAVEVVLFSMPTVLPVTEVSMNYASVVFGGFAAISIIWYFVQGRHVYKGPPDSEGLKA